MGNRNIKKEAKKPKKSLDTASVSASKPITTQPVLIKKEKKIK